MMFCWRGGVKLGASLVLSGILAFTFLPVPQAQAKEKVLGTRAGHTYYYTVKKANYRIEREATNSDNTKDKLNAWAKNSLDLVMCFAGAEIAVPYTLLTQAVGSSNIKVREGSYTSYAMQISSKIYTYYAYTDKKKTRKRVVYKCEKGKMDVFAEFHPVGVGFSKSTYTKRVKKKVKVSYGKGDKSAILTQCAANYPRNACMTFSLKSKVIAVSEKWVKK